MKSIVAGVLVLTGLVIAAFAVQPEAVENTKNDAMNNTKQTEPAPTDGAEKASRTDQQEEKFVYFQMTTSLGEIYLELDNEHAPISTANFLSYVEDSYYDGTIFHRVIPTFMIQGGGFTEDMKQKKTKDPIQNEWTNGLKNTRGTIAMARTSVPDSATSQFFINVTDNGSLDQPRGGAAYAVFGRVVKGMDTVDKIRAVATRTKRGMGDVPIETVMIEKVIVLTAEKATELGLAEAEG